MGIFGWETIVACAVAISCLALIPEIRTGERKDRFFAILSAIVLATWQPEGLLVTLGMTAIVWLMIQGRTKATGSKPHLWTILGVILLLVPLLASRTLPWLISFPGHVTGSSLPRWLVPLGLSFTTFRLIGVFLDSSALRINVSPSRLMFISLFFPTFLCGPITTLQSLKDRGNEGMSRSEMIRAGERILLGLGRKLLLADTIKQFVMDPWLARGVGEMEPYQCLVMPLVFGMYIYWDFAGYSDIAIGTAGLFGYRVPENFNRPYISRNLIEFWRRWHITLSEWIRIRLMMKIAGRRAGIGRFSIAALISMALCGMWHGVGIGYLLWGLWHGTGIVAVHLYGEARKRSERSQNVIRKMIGELGSTIITFVYVTIGWVWFFLPPAEGVTLIRRGMQWRGGTATDFLVPAGLTAALLAAYAAREQGNRLWERIPQPVRGTLYAVFLGLVTFTLLFSRGAKQEFIYTQF
ncbi:MAG: MBOAT family O-acyltransferase [bacterium]